MTTVQEFYDRQWKSPEPDIFARAFTEAIQYSYSFLGELRGKKLLEIGGGSGEQACFFAGQGAAVTVIDISKASLEATAQRARQQGVSLAAVPMNAEQLQFPAECFDLIYINSTLMHVNQQNVLQECSRVLAAGGKLVVVEPLQHAPLVQAYRLLSSYRKMRPHYATFKMFAAGKKYFSRLTHQEFYFFSSLLLPVFFVNNRGLQRLYQAVAAVDKRLLALLPFLRYGCWVSVVQYLK